jgi:hypothetical protein
LILFLHNRLLLLLLLFFFAIFGAQKRAKFAPHTNHALLFDPWAYLVVAVYSPEQQSDTRREVSSGHPVKLFLRVTGCPLGFLKTFYNKKS